MLLVLFCGQTLTRQTGFAQTLGGSSTFNFLKLPPAPQTTALGSVNISHYSQDVGMVMNNPALLRSEMHGQVSASFNSMYAGSKVFNLAAAFSLEKFKTDVAVGITYLNYGNINQTDASGNWLGEFRPADYLVQVSASRKYEDRWQYGFAVKFLQSQYGQYSSNAIALDAGATYYDSSHKLQVGLVFKNMGAQLKPFVTGSNEELPFDIQLGVSKRLSNAPIQFSVTAHRLNRFNLDYNDESGTDDLGQNSNKGSVFEKVLQHLVFATQIYIEEKLEISAGYNHLRRNELSVAAGPNGLTGFSLGIGLLTRKLQIRYARSSYQSNSAYNHFGLGVLIF